MVSEMIANVDDELKESIRRWQLLRQKYDVIVTELVNEEMTMHTILDEKLSAANKKGV